MQSCVIAALVKSTAINGLVILSAWSHSGVINHRWPICAGLEPFSWNLCRKETRVMTFQSPKSESHGMSNVSPSFRESQRTCTPIPINVFTIYKSDFLLLSLFLPVSSLKKALLKDKVLRITVSLTYMLFLWSGPHPQNTQAAVCWEYITRQSTTNPWGLPIISPF